MLPLSAVSSALAAARAASAAPGSRLLDQRLLLHSDHGLSHGAPHLLPLCPATCAESEYASKSTSDSEDIVVTICARESDRRSSGSR